MTRFLPRRTVLAGALVIAFGAAGGTTAVAKTGPVKKQVSAKLVAYGWKDDDCHSRIGVVYGNAPGATSYLITYWDGYYKQVTSHTVPAAQADAGLEPRLRRLIPAGKHYVNATGGNGGGADCVLDVSDATGGGRFSKGAKAWAIYSGGRTEHFISGTVVGTSCSALSCTKAPQAGVTVAVSGSGGPEHAQTDSSGAYSVQVEDGTYTVRPSLGGKTFDPVSRGGVVVDGKDVGGLNFETCTLGPCYALHAQEVRTGNSQLDKLPIHVAYTGKGWDASKGPITVFFGGRKAKVLPAAATFEGVIVGTDWPHRDRFNAPDPSCKGVLMAQQGANRSQLVLSARAAGFAMFADLDPVIHTGQVYCAGEEDSVLQRTPGTVIVYGPGVARFTVYGGGNRIPLILANTGPNTQVLCVNLTRPRGHITFTSVNKTTLFDVTRLPGRC